MKRSKHQLLGNLAAVLLAGMALMSCSQEDATLSSGKLLDGKYPLVLTASIDDAGTRYSSSNGFEEGDVVGVKLGDDGTAAQYVIGSDLSTLSPASTDETIYWQELAATTVYGWYPYAAQTSVTISDQSNGYADYDYLTATAENQAVGNTVKLKFKHQMAKVTFTLTKGTDMDMDNATVKVFGYTIANFSEGVLTGETNGEITPIYSYESSTLTGTGEVLLVPQDMSGQQFIEIIDNTNSTTYYYTPTSANLEAGCSYTFDITVGSDYTITTDEEAGTTTYTVYTETGLLAWAAVAASDLTTNCTLGADITLTEPESGESNWTPIGESGEGYGGTFDGNGHTIYNLTINTSNDDQGLIGGLGVNSGEDDGEGNAIYVGEVKNLTLADVSISSSSALGCVGAVVGYNEGGAVTNCSSTGEVSGESNVGGVVGNNEGGSVTACYSTVSVTCPNGAGGVVGNNYNGTVIACYATGNIDEGNESAVGYLGGVVGYNDEGSVIACYSTGNVSATGAAAIGGVVGYNANTVTACYWSSTVTDGIGQDDGDTAGETTQVTGDVTWADTALSAMNTALTGKGWQYEENTDSNTSTAQPLLLVEE